MPTYARLPVEFVRGEGARLWDAEGNEYLDFLAGISVVQRSATATRTSSRRSASRPARLMHIVNLFYTEPAMRLAERLSRARRSAARVFFCNSGAEANEAAIKLARKAQAAAATIVVARTAPSTAARRRALGDAAGDQAGAVRAARARASVPCAHDRRARSRPPSTSSTAAVLLEPIQGETRRLADLPTTMLRAARDGVRPHGALLIFDEIQCGMGRTGHAVGLRADGGACPTR